MCVHLRVCVCARVLKRTVPEAQLSLPFLPGAFTEFSGGVAWALVDLRTGLPQEVVDPTGRLTVLHSLRPFF